MKDSVTDEIRKTLMESAAWDRLDITPKFLNEDDEKEASEEEAEESEEESEEGSEEEVSDEAEAAVEEEYSNLELLHMLLSEMSDDDLLEHIGEVLEVVDEAADVIEEELEEEDHA